MKNLKATFISPFIFALATNAVAQSGQQVLRGILEAARQGQPQAQQVAPALNRPTVPVPNQGPWATKQSFVDHARSGRLLGFSDVNLDDSARIAGALYYLMASDMGVPPLPEDCRATFRLQTSQLIAAINRAQQEGLSSTTPDFTPKSFTRASQTELVQRHMNTLRDVGGGHTLCESVVMGRPVPHPFQAALIQLGLEYDQASYEFVQAEQIRRQAEYRQKLATQQTDEQKRQAAARADEQQRINAEAARVRADEQRRAAKEKSRVGG